MMHVRFSTVLPLLLLFLAACTGGDRMRRDLARLEARNQADSLLTDSVLAQRLADYFAHHGTQAERLEAHYLLARTWADLGQAPRALDAYHTAAEQADTTHLDSLSCHFLSRIYGQMGGLFYDYHLHRNALEAFVKAGIYADNANEEAISVGFLGQRSHCLYHLGMKDSATIITKEVVKRLLAMKDTLSANTWLGPLICDYLEKEKYTEADSCLYLYQHHSYVTPEALQHYEPWKLLYVYIGNLYLGVHQPDSALSAFYKELSICNSYNNKGLAYHGLYQTYTYLHKPDSVQKYALLYAEMNDSTEKSTTATALLSMHHLYDYSSYQRLAQVKTLAAARAMRIVMLLVFIILVILLIVSFSIVYIRQRSSLLRIRLKNQYAKNQERYDIVKRRLEELKHQHQLDESKLKQTQETLESLKSVLEETRRKHPTIDEWDNEDNYLDIPIVKKAKVQAARGEELSDQDWINLRRATNTFLPGFIDALCNLGKELSLKETNVCILVKLGFSPTDIKNLMGMSSSSLANLRKRLLWKLFKTDGSPQKLDERIRLMTYPEA